MRRLGTVIVITSSVIAYACGGGSKTKTDGGIDSHKHDATVDGPDDAHIDAPPDVPGNFVMLTVKNYQGWCSVKIGGRTFSPASETIVYETPSVAALTASPNLGYTLGSNMWHLTDGDPGYGGGSSTNESIGEPGTQAAGSGSGSGSAGTSTASATLALGSAKCVWVCCPQLGTSNCDGLLEQCQ
jgi:hypothetical protein